MEIRKLPEHVRSIDRQSSFRFSCHPGVACFNECCHQLDLALSPYDVLRLKQALGLSSELFLDRYALVEEDDSSFPVVYLAMVDDGRASCPFVAEGGCTVYAERPAACRLYPVGRAAQCRDDGCIDDMLVLLTENHCQGFADSSEHSIDTWLDDQGLSPYLAANDRYLLLTSQLLDQVGSAQIKKGLDTFLFALYNLDQFRQALISGELGSAGLDVGYEMIRHDEELLVIAAAWLLLTLPVVAQGT